MLPSFFKNPESNEEFLTVSNSTGFTSTNKENMTMVDSISNTEFLAHIKNLENIDEKKKMKIDVRELFRVAKSSGLSAKELDDIVEFLTTMPIDEKLFKHLILCMIPNNNTVPANVVKKVISWILVKYMEEDNDKIDNLLSWVTSLLDCHIIDKNVIDEYYCLLWCLLQFYPRAIYRLMYVLTKSDDVTFWRVNFIKTLIQKLGPEPYLCALLKHFIELNSQFAHIEVPQYKRVSQNNNEFYNTLRANLKNRHLSDNVSTVSIVVPSEQRAKKTSKIRNGLLPNVQYLELDKKFDETFITDIKNGVHFVKSFRKITLPSNTLSLLNNPMGIRFLMFTNRSIQEQFLQNLFAVMEQSLISQQAAAAYEVAELLDNVIRLHHTFQQGFIAVSNILKLYLQFWDGVQYKKQIYSLLEWFVFKTNIEMNRFLLKPLHSLFISNSAEEMCEIIFCLTNLLTNMYLAIGKDDENFLYLLKENTLSSRDELVPVIHSLTKFVSELLKISLYIYPRNNQILLASIAFYEKINYLERLYEMQFWTIISSNVMYHSLFSFNALLLDQICKLYKSYNSVAKLPIANSSQKMKEKVIRLQNYAQDIYNFLWSSRAFADRTSGHVFRGLSLEDEAEWKNFVNLNNALTLERHVMFAPYRMMNNCVKNPESSLFLSKESILNIMKSPTPNLVEFITKMVNEKLAEDEDESD